MPPLARTSTPPPHTTCTKFCGRHVVVTFASVENVDEQQLLATSPATPRACLRDVLVHAVERLCRHKDVSHTQQLAITRTLYKWARAHRHVKQGAVLHCDTQFGCFVVRLPACIYTNLEQMPVMCTQADLRLQQRHVFDAQTC